MNFHRKIIKLFSAHTWASIRLLKCNGRAVAGSYKLEYNGTVYFYLPAYDPAFKTKIGLGLIERSYDIEQAIKDGFKFYDFYKAGEGSYKWHLAKDKRQVTELLICRKDFQYFALSGLRKAKRVARSVIAKERSE